MIQLRKMDFTSYPISRKAFRVEACIDWLALAIHIARPTQFRYVQEALERAGCGKLRVDALAETAGGVSDTFVIRVHDNLANDVAALRAKLDKVSKEYPVVGEPVIVGIEIACDFWHKGPAALHIRDTLAMTYRLQSSLFAKDATKPRQFDCELGESGANRFLNVAGARLDPGLNFRIGNKWDSVSWQVYFKSVDKIKSVDKTKPLPQLPQSKWRARVEATLQGEAPQAYGLRTLSDFEGYSFTRLTPLFRFRRPIEPERLAKGNGYVANAIRLNRKFKDATPERGIHSFASIGRKDRKSRNGERAESRHIETDNELQDAVKGALKRLSV